MTNPQQQLTVASSPRRFQMSLRGLLLTVTYCAVSFGVAAVTNVGMLVLMAGIFLTWLSFRGHLSWFQSDEARPKVFGLAWVLFGTSMILPSLVSPGCGKSPRPVDYGWQVAWQGVALTSAGIEESFTSKWREGVQLVAQSLVYSLPNLLMVVSPILHYWRPNSRADLAAVWGCAAVSSWMWGPFAWIDLRIGYFVWATAISLEFLRRKIGWRTIATMLAMTFVAYFLPWIFQYLENQRTPGSFSISRICEPGPNSPAAFPTRS